MYTLEYSHEQDALHIDEFDHVIKRNNKMLEEKKYNDYKIIGIFDTYDEALKASKEFRDKIGYRSVKFRD